MYTSTDMHIWIPIAVRAYTHEYPEKSQAGAWASGLVALRPSA